MFVWVDMETTGLNANSDVPLELGIAITDDQLRWVASRCWLVYWPSNASGKPTGLVMDDFVQDMHLKSGLWEALQCGERKTCSQIEEGALLFLMGHGALGEPMCGSSIFFDRTFMRAYFPKLEAAFHYRNVDVSSIKEIYQRVNPAVVNTRPKPYTEHRVISDISDTIGELQHYLSFMKGI